MELVGCLMDFVLGNCQRFTFPLYFDIEMTYLLVLLCLVLSSQSTLKKINIKVFFLFNHTKVEQNE